MMKRIVAMVLCLVCLALCFTACGNKDDKGASIRMYLSEPVYDVDPLNAFDNQATLQIVSLIFEGLFTADEDGDVKKALVDDYEYEVDKELGTYKLILTLRETKWSDGVPVTASDAQYAFLRLFSSAVNHPAVGMLFDIKNARTIAAGEDSVDHLAVTVTDPQTLEIEFEKDIDIDAFLPVLTSPALYPLRADKIDTGKVETPEGNIESVWSKIGDEIVCSGPFMINSMDDKAKDGFMLERNGYYYRDREKDDYDKYVRPYRIIVDYSTPAIDQLKNYNTGEVGNIYYMGYIPLAARTDEYADILKKLDVTNSNSTHVYYMNQAVAPFDNASVRKALSLALDREEMAKALVYADAADALVPQSILYRADKGATFRDKAESYLQTAANINEAKQLLSSAGINASSYSFTLTVNGISEEQVKLGEMAVAAWKALGFKVTLNKLGIEPIIKVEKGESEEDNKEVATGAYKSLYREALQSGSFDVIGLDLVSTAPTAMSYLAPFAAAFSGNGYSASVNGEGKTVYSINPHVTGYNSADYNAKIDAAQNAKNEKERAKLLVEAEAILMNDLPVIPVVYNKNTALDGKKLSGVKAGFFCPHVLTDAKLSGYRKVAIREGFVEED
ncbi:MAG: hypothetical protein IJF31_05100 [Clostridia bacterium]|nr:hypothetical protein [Clostridia bacterium]